MASGFWHRIIVSDINIAAPILDDVDISYHVQDFDGRFVKESIYRQVGSPEVDAAWEDLGVGCKISSSSFCFSIMFMIFKTDRSVLLPASRSQEAGLSSSHAHAREKYSGGYPVYVEGLHQLHCLVGRFFDIFEAMLII